MAWKCTSDCVEDRCGVQVAEAGVNKGWCDSYYRTTIMSHPSFTLAFLTSHPLWFLCPLFPPFIGEEMYWNKMLWCSDCLLSFCPVTLLEACPMTLYPLCLLKNALSFQLLSSPVHTYSHSCLLKILTFVLLFEVYVSLTLWQPFSNCVYRNPRVPQKFIRGLSVII